MSGNPEILIERLQMFVEPWSECTAMSITAIMTLALFSPRAVLKGPKRSFVDPELCSKVLKEASLFLFLAWNQYKKKRYKKCLRTKFVAKSTENVAKGTKMFVNKVCSKSSKKCCNGKKITPNSWPCMAFSWSFYSNLMVFYSLLMVFYGKISILLAL